MKKLLALLTAIAAFGLLPSVSWAVCVASGEISRVSVNVNTGVHSFFVRTSTPGSASFLFNTSDQSVVTAAFTAQASHMRVQVTGSASECGAAVNGIRGGGTVTLITTAP
jgi:hypothetical protein